MDIKGWFIGLFKKSDQVKEDVEPQWPDDIWELMYFLADKAEGIEMPELGNQYFDAIIEVTTINSHQLFRRIETMLNCIDIQDDMPEWWKDRARDKVETPMAMYFYDRRNGYTQPQVVLTKLIEKVAVIHHQLASQEINESHVYYHYMRREFFQVVSDIVELLIGCINLGKPK